MELPSNDIDSFIDEGIKQAEQFNRGVEQERNLIHRVFAQSEDGIALLAKWTEQMIMIPTVEPHSTQFEAGINEGHKSFVRSIITQIERVETETNSENDNE